MKRRHLKLILIAACVLMCAGALAACRPQRRTPADLAAEGYSCEVKFDLMGGFSGDINNENRQYYELYEYAAPNSLIVKPGDASRDSNHYTGEEPPVKAGYTLGGYYRGTKDADGNVTYGEKWDFDKDRVTESLTLYAYWRENYTLVVHYGFDATEGSGSTAEFSVAQDEDGVASMMGAPAISDHTVIAFYADKASALNKDAEGAIAFPHTPTELTEEAPRWEIWADALEGVYKLVRTVSDLSFYDGDNIYLMNDIDCKNAELSFPESYIATFCGNGHTISNFTMTRESAKTRDDYLGFFKRIGAAAVIQDVTFSNFTLNVKTTNSNFEYTIGSLAGRIAAGAQLHNVHVSGTVNCTSLTGRDVVVKEFIGEEEKGAVIDGCTDNVTITGYDPSLWQKQEQAQP